MDEEPKSLSELVFIAMRRHETTAMTRLSDIAQVHGFNITHTVLSQIRLRRYNHRPRAHTIKALAFLSGVPVGTVNELAGRGSVLGSFVRQLPDEIDLLRGSAREALIRLARVLVDMERENLRLQGELSKATPEDEDDDSVMPESELPFPIPREDPGEGHQNGSSGASSI